MEEEEELPVATCLPFRDDGPPGDAAVDAAVPPFCSFLSCGCAISLLVEACRYGTTRVLSAFTDTV